MSSNVFNQITDLSSVVTFGYPDDANTYDVDIQVGNTAILLQAEAQDIRWRHDGTNPTSSVGMILKAGADPIRLDIASITKLKMIEAVAGAKLNYAFVAERPSA